MEDAYSIKGGNKLQGEVTLSGAKNVALKTIIAALLFDAKVVLHNVPRIRDVDELLSLIQSLGGRAEFVENNIVEIDGRTITSNKVDLLHGSKTRVSFMLFAPLLHKFKECFIPNPGGCRIGARPIDRIVEGMQQLGVQVEYNSDTGYYQAKLANSLKGYYRFSKPSHTGTELLIALSAIGNDKVTLDNAALEPEVDELIRFLNESGARIERRGGNITVYGVEKLEQKTSHAIIPDRNEAVTYAVLGLATKGNITISHIHEMYIKAFNNKIKEAGGTIKKINDTTWNYIYERPLKATTITTEPHPGFMTDWQPVWAVLMSQAQGTSIIQERVFENRFSYVEELRKLGAHIDFVKLPINNPKDWFFFNFDPRKLYNQAIRIKGGHELHGGVVTISDMRAGATLAIAALIAKGESVANGVSIMERGYEKFVEKVQKLGGQIQKV